MKKDLNAGSSGPPCAFGAVHFGGRPLEVELTAHLQSMNMMYGELASPHELILFSKIGKDEKET